MWVQNNYVKTFAGISLAALLLITLTPDRSQADGTGADGTRADGTRADGTRADGTRADGEAGVKQTSRSSQSQTANQPRAVHRGQAGNHGQSSQQAAYDRTRPNSYQPSSPTPPAQQSYSRNPSPNVDTRFLPPANYAAPGLPTTSFVAPASATQPPMSRRPQYAPPSPIGKGLPEGKWTNETPLGEVTLTVTGNKIAIDVACTGELAGFQPSMRGEFSVASDGTVYGLIHSVDAGVAASVAEDMGEEWMFLGGLSDIPFSMRAYSEPGVLAIKQVSIGMPMQVVIATDGECGQFGLYAQAMMAGLYEKN